jgi:hypothetical protein
VIETAISGQSQLAILIRVTEEYLDNLTRKATGFPHRMTSKKPVLMRFLPIASEKKAKPAVARFVQYYCMLLW